MTILQDVEEVRSLLSRYKAGKGSHPHAGRPGKRGGSAKGDKGSAPASPVVIKLASFEKSISELPYEEAAVIDTQGRILATQTGLRSEVRLSTEMLAMIKGNVMTHNHPGGTSFSPEDIAVAVRFGARETRAVTKKYVYRMIFASDFDYSKENSARLATKGDNMGDVIYHENMAKIYAGKLTIPEAEASHWNEVWTRVVMKEPGLVYKRVARRNPANA